MKKVVSRVLLIIMCLMIVSTTVMVTPVRTNANPVVLLPAIEQALATLLVACGLEFSTEQDAKNGANSFYNYAEKRYGNVFKLWLNAIGAVISGPPSIPDNILDMAKEYVKYIAQGSDNGIATVIDTYISYSGSYPDPNLIANYDTAGLSNFIGFDPAKSTKFIVEQAGVTYLNVVYYRVGNMCNYEYRVKLGVNNVYTSIFCSYMANNIFFKLNGGKWTYWSSGPYSVQQNNIQSYVDNISTQVWGYKNEVKWTDTDILNMTTGSNYMSASGRETVSYTASIQGIVNATNYLSSYDFKDTETGERYIPKINSTSEIVNKTYVNVTNVTKVINTCSYKTSWTGKFSASGTGSIPYKLTGRWTPAINYIGDVTEITGTWNVAWKYNDYTSSWDCSGTMVTTQDTVTDVPATFKFTGVISKDVAQTTTGNPAEEFPGNPETELPKMKVPADIIKNKFPFCIPWDIKNAISALVVTPEAPKWTINFDKKYFVGGCSFDIDFAQFEVWAKIIRWSVLFTFNFWLIMKTRIIIGAS